MYDTLLECGLLPVIHTSTRSNFKNESIIDEIFLSFKCLLNVTNALTVNVDVGITDHTLQCLIFENDVSHEEKLKVC